MPNDDLFEPESPPNPSVEGDSKPEGAPGPKLAEQLSALTSTLGQLASVTAQTNARVDALAQRTFQAEPTVEEPVAGADGRPLTKEQQTFSKFYENPEAFIAKAAGELVKRELGPHLKLQAEQQAEIFEREQRERIDGIFGTGTWDAEYAADFAETVGKLPVEMRSSRRHVEAGVSAIHGRKDLAPDSKKGLETRRQNVEKAKQAAAAPAMLSNGMPRPRSGAGEMSAQETEFLAKLSRNGVKYTREQYLASRERGGSETAWKAAKAEKSKSASGAGKGV